VYALAILTLVASLAAPEARHDLAAADRLAVAIDRASTRAAANVESRSAECVDAASPPASARSELFWLPVKFELRVANRIAVPAYQRFARVVALGRSRDATLRAYRSYVARLAAQDRRLATIRLNFCAFVDDWRRAGWPRNYFDTWEAERLERAGVDAALVDRLGLRLERLASGFRRLGLTPDAADRVVTTAEITL
jgi:hypothetical protein